MSAGIGAAIAALAEDQRRLNPKVDVVVVRQPISGSIDVDVADRQQIQHAAEDVEVAVLLAQRPHQRVHDRRAPARRAWPRRCGGPPVLPRSASATRCCDRRRRRRARSGRRAGSQQRRQLPSRSTRAVTSSIVTMTPVIRPSSRIGPMVTCCCIRSKRGRRRPTAAQAIR